MQRIILIMVILLSGAAALYAEATESTSATSAKAETNSTATETKGDAAESASPSTASEILQTQKGDEENKGEFSDAIFGAGMWPIWLCSLVLIALIFERIKGLKREKIIDRSMIDAFTDHVARHEMDDAQALAQDSDTVVGKAWSQAVDEFNIGGVSVQDALTNKTVLAFKPLKRNLQAIATLGVISPLLGLLGTVSGMILVFQQISATGGADKSELAMGIGLALFTTAGGLIVSIPAIISGRFFNSRLIGYGEEIEDDIHRVSYRYNSFDDSDDSKNLSDEAFSHASTKLNVKPIDADKEEESKSKEEAAS
ncbi:MAG: MotA/TolQ/ExbB proton channel family protein [Planctomycetes bacterium]|nr:MotA/TolQ/ExbB proton channel family protein [Planctomycetota bacterium]